MGGSYINIAIRIKYRPPSIKDETTADAFLSGKYKILHEIDQTISKYKNSGSFFSVRFSFQTRVIIALHGFLYF